MIQKTGARDQIVSYQKLRAFIGITGLLLPVLCVLGCFIAGAGKQSWQISISHYYYSVMHIVFVAIFCVLGGFLITYKGRDKCESRLSNFAGLSALGVAAFPTSSKKFIPNPDGSNQYLQLHREVSDLANSAHYGLALCLLSCFIIFCLYFFQKPDFTYTDKDLIKFERRKICYKICGRIIIVSIVLIGLFDYVIKPKEGLFVYSTFIFETSALWAFGIAWLIKGSAVLTRVPVMKKLIQPIR